ncbi:unnamed protein product, partial [Ilex paraguariensis]
DKQIQYGPHLRATIGQQLEGKHSAHEEGDAKSVWQVPTNHQNPQGIKDSLQETIHGHKNEMHSPIDTCGSTIENKKLEPLMERNDKQQ